MCRNNDRLNLNTKVKGVENGHAINCMAGYEFYLWKIALPARNFISGNNRSCKRELLSRRQNYFPTTFGFSFTYGDVNMAVI